MLRWSLMWSADISPSKFQHSLKTRDTTRQEAALKQHISTLPGLCLGTGQEAAGQPHAATSQDRGQHCKQLARSKKSHGEQARKGPEPTSASTLPSWHPMPLHKEQLGRPQGSRSLSCVARGEGRAEGPLQALLWLESRAHTRDAVLALCGHGQQLHAAARWRGASGKGQMEKAGCWPGSSDPAHKHQKYKRLTAEPLLSYSSEAFGLLKPSLSLPQQTAIDLNPCGKHYDQGASSLHKSNIPPVKPGGRAALKIVYNFSLYIYMYIYTYTHTHTICIPIYIFWLPVAFIG